MLDSRLNNSFSNGTTPTMLKHRWNKIFQPLVQNTNQNLEGLPSHRGLHQSYVDQCHLMRELQEQKILINHYEKQLFTNNISKSHNSRQPMQGGKKSYASKNIQDSELDLKDFEQEEPARNQTSIKKKKKVDFMQDIDQSPELRKKSFGTNLELKPKPTILSSNDKSIGDDLQFHSTQITSLKTEYDKQRLEQDERINTIEVEVQRMLKYVLKTEQNHSSKIDNQASELNLLKSQFSNLTMKFNELQSEHTLLLNSNKNIKIPDYNVLQQKLLEELGTFKTQLSTRVNSMNEYSLQKYNKIKETLTQDVDDFTKLQQEKINQTIKNINTGDEVQFVRQQDQLKELQKEIDYFKDMLIGGIDTALQGEQIKQSMIDKMLDMIKVNQVEIQNHSQVNVEHQDQIAEAVLNLKQGMEQELEHYREESENKYLDILSQNKLLEIQLEEIRTNFLEIKREQIDKKVIEPQHEKTSTGGIETEQSLKFQNAKSMLPFEQRVSRFNANTSDVDVYLQAARQRKRLRDYTFDETIRKSRFLNTQEGFEFDELHYKFEENTIRYYSQQREGMNNSLDRDYNDSFNFLQGGRSQQQILKQQKKQQQELKKQTQQQNQKIQSPEYLISFNKEGELSPSPVADKVRLITSRDNPLTMSQLNDEQQQFSQNGNSHQKQQKITDNQNQNIRTSFHEEFIKLGSKNQSKIRSPNQKVRNNGRNQQKIPSAERYQKEDVEQQNSPLKQNYFYMKTSAAKDSGFKNSIQNSSNLKNHSTQLEEPIFQHARQSRNSQRDKNQDYDNDERKYDFGIQQFEDGEIIYNEGQDNRENFESSKDHRFTLGSSVMDQSQNKQNYLQNQYMKTPSFRLD
ncbi:UNKNOWN [Stylonychia lemnae]|uniref:Uncharacterized protein n=1 Tax=Stylonychia lemnae TaxID=5949 RepID=A0A078AN17_STYLE|nr:UNKNOWN [Stylonychia lemnae]|eukprot:CDW83326.1 UNKNOWN [Stylonychia lemnae]